MKKLSISDLFLYLPLLGMIFTGCKKENGESDGIQSGEITKINVCGLIGDETPKSKAHWSEEGGKLLFYWDTDNDEMKSSVVGGSGFKAFVGSNNVSQVTVSPVSGERLKANLLVLNELSENYETGDKFYAFSPVKSGLSSVSTDGGKVTFQMGIPMSQKYVASDKTSHISQYAYMVGEGTVVVSGNTASTEVPFDILPTFLCFNVTNKYFDNLEISSVYIAGEGLNDSAVMTIEPSEGGKLSVQYSDTYQPNQYVINTEEVSIGKDESIIIYGVSFPSTINAGKSIKFGLYGSCDGKTLNVEKTVTLKSDLEFKSNYYQTFNMPISMTGMEVSWDVTSWGPITETPVTGTSDTIGAESSVGSWNDMTENNVTANENN